MVRRLRFSLRTAIILMTFMVVSFGLVANYFHRSTQQQHAVAKLQLLAADGCQLHVFYNNIYEWDPNLGKHKRDVPQSYRWQGNTLVPTGIEGWIERNFGIDFLYKPVQLHYTCPSNRQLHFTDEMIELINMLPIQEIALYRYYESEIFSTATHRTHMRREDVTTDEEVRKAAALFPGTIVVRDGR